MYLVIKQRQITTYYKIINSNDIKQIGKWTTSLKVNKSQTP